MLPLAAIEPLTSPIIVGLVVGMPATLFGVKAYRRAEALDKAAVQSALVASQGDAVKLVIDGLDRIIDNLQTDNVEVREENVRIRKALEICRETCERLRTERP